ncbi:MAG: UDP-N-acetylenolpyruvoylglucosamine reductase, partial [Flammeovirgaceae bacterium]|nr:UDP-N-acetylenolpyruvoylglucosamine reductase [Flammeovirgaceae bacterium]
MIFKNNISIKKYNSFKVDHKIKKFYRIQSKEEMIKVKRSISKNEKIIILGGGSNILFTKNFNGSILYNNILGKEIIKETKKNIYIKFGAGENWDKSVEFCVKNKWYGIENLSLIPGSVGAAPIQNIGAYGTEIKDYIYEVSGINLSNGKSQIYENKLCNFSYRNSIFKGKLKNIFFITHVTIKLSKSKKLNLSYNEVKKYFRNKKSNEITIDNVRKKIIEIRESKLPDPKKLGNCGSFFKNPLVDFYFFNNLKNKYPDIIGFKNSNGMKISAAWLIEKCGWKGYKKDNIGVYKNHALVLVNYGSNNG